MMKVVKIDISQRDITFESMEQKTHDELEMLTQDQLSNEYYQSAAPTAVTVAPEEKKEVRI